MPRGSSAFYDAELLAHEQYVYKCRNSGIAYFNHVHISADFKRAGGHELETVATYGCEAGIG